MSSYSNFDLIVINALHTLLKGEFVNTPVIYWDKFLQKDLAKKGEYIRYYSNGDETVSQLTAANTRKYNYQLSYYFQYSGEQKKDKFTSRITDRTNHLEYFVDILDIPLTNTFDAGSISTAQRYIKNWITQTDKEMVIPMQHFKIVYDVLTDNTKSLSNRDFIKAMNRLNIKSIRKRMGEGKYSSAPRGVLIIWLLAEDVKQSILETHFDEKDIQLVNKGFH